MFRFFFSFMVLAPEGLVSGGGGGTGSASTASATVASTPTPGSTQTSASPTGTQQSTQSTATQSATQQTAPVQAADDIQDGNWKELRSRYESQKAELATLKQNSSPQVTAVLTKAQGLAKQLGYTDQDFMEAFTADPIKTISILNQEAGEAQTTQQQTTPDLKSQIDEAVSARLTPIQEFQNRQATEVAMNKYETHLGEAIKADPILSSAPQEVIDVVKDYLGEYFSTQPQVLLAMKTKHDFTAVNDALKFTAGRLHGAFKAWLSKGQPQTAATQTATTGKRPTLDEIINDPSVLGSQYK